jgi:oligopeptidase B
VQPPAAKRVPVERKIHGEVVIDEYAWLRDRDDPDTVAYLEAENAYTAEFMAPTKELQERLFEEIKGRVQETDEAAPAPKDQWSYYSRTVEGLDYEIHCRRAREGGPEEVLLDENEQAEGMEYFALGAFEISPDHQRVAFAVDDTGDISYTVMVKDLTSGEVLPERIDRVYGGVEWAADSRTLLYLRHDDAHRSYQLRRHRIGADAPDGSGDAVLYEEGDERFWLWLGSSRDGRWIVLHSASKVTSEARLLDAHAHAPDTDLRLVAQREQGVEYQVEPHGDRLFVITNADGASTFKLVEASVDRPGREHWRDVIGPDPDVTLDGVDAFAGHLAVYERGEALQRIRLVRLADMTTSIVEQPEEVYAASPGTNLEFETSTLRYSYRSLVTPPTAFDYDMGSGERKVVKRQPVLGGYDPERYETRRLWATAPDGERVPMSIVHRRGLPLGGSAPALLYGYGSYEDFYEPDFSFARLSLLERGWVVGIAHIRGGGEMGRRWYDDGKLLKKQNSFTDFVAAGEHLVGLGYTSTERLAARGGSAGGLLMGAVANMRPDLFAAIVAQVPFVDVVNTMLDETLPLTVTEWEEWGDPNDPELYAYMRSYAPYENVAPADYPATLVTAGINDSQVQYWEPAKWVARLRATATGDRPILLKTQMGAGHRGPSGRYDAWREEAFVLAFLLHVIGPVM